MKLKRFIPIAMIIMVGVFLYTRFVNDIESRLKINLSGNAKYMVTERGHLDYGNSKNVNIKNEYEVLMNITPRKDTFLITGEISEIKAHVLLPFVKSNSFHIVSDNNFCPSKMSFIYPAELRRLNYYIPQSEIFRNKSWRKYFCKNTFNCEYIVERIEKSVAEISVKCSGYAGDKNIDVYSFLSYSDKMNIYTSAEMDITVKTGSVQSDWYFSERIKK